MTDKIKCPRCDEVGMAEITKAPNSQGAFEIYCNSCGIVTVVDREVTSLKIPSHEVTDPER